MNNDTKYCHKCNSLKPVSQFSKCSSRKDGLQTQCKVCKKITSTEWAKNNRKASSLATRKWQLANPEIDLHNRQKWRKNNPEKNRANTAKWAKANPEKIRESEHRRRANMAQNMSYAIRPSFLKKLYLSPCNNCGQTGNIHMDHVIPISRGGTHGEGNLQPLCQRCNTSKGNKFMMEWITRELHSTPTTSACGLNCCRN